MGGPIRDGTRRGRKHLWIYIMLPVSRILFSLPPFFSLLRSVLWHIFFTLSSPPSRLPAQSLVPFLFPPNCSRPKALNSIPLSSFFSSFLFSSPPLSFLHFFILVAEHVVAIKWNFHACLWGPRTRRENRWKYRSIDPSAGNLKYIPAPVISCRCYSFPFHSDNVIVTYDIRVHPFQSIDLLFSIFAINASLIDRWLDRIECNVNGEKEGREKLGRILVVGRKCFN